MNSEKHEPKPLAPKIEQTEIPQEVSPEKNQNLEWKNEKIKIEEYLSQTLPESEERIGAPMISRCEVSIIIPAYGEREIILRPLESLLRQEGIENEAFEVIIVVNNPPTPPEKRHNENERDHERALVQYNEALKNNQDTLRLLRYLNGSEENIQLSDQEKEICEKIRKSGLKVYWIDKASQGKTFSQQEANVGGARNRGVAEAVARFYEQARNGIIAQVDADVRFDENYIKNLIKFFNDNPKLVGLSGSTDYEYIDTPDRALHEKLSMYSDMGYYYGDLEEFYKIQKPTQKQKEQEQADIANLFIGSNMASRAYEAAVVGGVPKLHGSEDPGFGKRLSSIGEIKRVQEIITYPGIRFSSRVDVDAGIGQRRIKFAEMLTEKGTILVKTPEQITLRRQVRERVLETIKDKKLNTNTLRTIFTVADDEIFNETELKLFAQVLQENDMEINKLEGDERIIPLYEKFNTFLLKKYPPEAIEKAAPKLIDVLCEDKDIREKYQSTLNGLLKENDVDETSGEAELVAIKLKAMYIVVIAIQQHFQ